LGAILHAVFSFSQFNVFDVFILTKIGKTEYILILIVFNLFFLVFIGGIVIFVSQYKHKKKQHESAMSQQQEQFQKDILATQVEIQSQTMQYIGREIHDHVGQKLNLASIYTQQLAYENKAPHIYQNIDLSQIINESLEDLRVLSKSLTHDFIEHNTLNKLLQQQCDQINQLKKCIVQCNGTEIDYQRKSILFRISQEFIINSLKHAKCNTIHIKLFHVENQLHLHFR
jgi:signal transduction histidine kinase